MPSGLLIIGIGNDTRGDDAVGLVVARALKTRLPQVRIVESSGEPAGLIELWNGAGRVHVVDAVQAGGQAGSIYRIDLMREELPAPLSRGSTHILGFGEAIELARALSMLPEKLIFWGIEVAQFEHGSPMSAPVSAALNELQARILEDCTT